MVEVTDKLVSVRDGSIVGFLVSAGGQYKVGVTSVFGKGHEVRDMDIADYLDVPTIDVVPIGSSKYGVVGREIGFIDTLEDVPCEPLGANTAYWGYLFKEQCIVPLDSEAAFNRMIEEARGNVVE